MKLPAKKDRKPKKDRGNVAKIGDRVEIKPARAGMKIPFPENQPAGKALAFLGEGWTRARFTPYVRALARDKSIEVRAVTAAAVEETKKPAAKPTAEKKGEA